MYCSVEERAKSECESFCFLVCLIFRYKAAFSVNVVLNVIDVSASSFHHQGSNFTCFLSGSQSYHS